MFRRRGGLINPKRALFCAVIGCLTLALCVPGFGQKRPRRGKIDIPFVFIVGGKKFPAGQYTLENVTPSYGLLRSSDGKIKEALYFSQTGEPVSNPHAVFAVRYNQYLFVGIIGWFGKMQYLGFNLHPDEEMKDVPITSLD